MCAVLRKKAIASLAALTLGGVSLTAATPASAAHYWHGGGWHGGWHGGPVGLGLGLGLGALATGAIIASGPYGYGYPGYYGYGYPGYYSYGYGACTSYQPTYDAWGNYIGRRPVNIC
jgi:hypothetical protein